ncbi:hypothetical protein DSO57_1015650 [Entomophthora muscae]|uniref:Uncharacterized protein n=1 Tax=Entomophthora muscae TaxID=34485 RepID=A0ACC2TG05_9FUNG|nr:hypothetical protein DSO57_1015650 [Entomophthora muscae]
MAIPSDRAPFLIFYPIPYVLSSQNQPIAPRHVANPPANPTKQAQHGLTKASPSFPIYLAYSTSLESPPRTQAQFATSNQRMKTTSHLSPTLNLPK